MQEKSKDEVRRVHNRNRRQRHPELLAHARELVLQSGPSGLTMERLASQAGYSRTTLYQHFKNRQAILAELAVEALSRILLVHDCAASLDLSSTRDQLRARILAYEWIARNEPKQFRVELILRPSEQCQTMPLPEQRRIRQLRQSIRRHYQEVLEQAIKSGELSPVPDVEAAFFLQAYALTSTTYLLALNRDEILPRLQIRDPFDIVRCGIEAAMNGYAWQPTTSISETKRWEALSGMLSNAVMRKQGLLL